MRTSKRTELQGVTHLGSDRYLIRVQKVDPRTGNQLDIRRRVRAASLEEAVAEKVRMQAEVAHGVQPPDRLRLGDYARSWLLGRLPTLKPSTRSRYTGDLDRHILPDLGAFFLDALGPEEVNAWFARKAQQQSAATVNGYLRLLKTIMADAVAQHGLQRDPTRRIRAIPDRHQAELESDDPLNILSADEMGRLLVVLRRRWPQRFTMVFLQFATARRFGEVSALRWEDIDEERAAANGGSAQTAIAQAPARERRSRNSARSGSYGVFSDGGGSHIG